VSKRAIIYARVSSEEQTRGYSLESQEELSRAYAAKHGYTVVAVIYDSHTAEQLDRPGLTQVLDLVATDTIDVLIVYHPDRFSRGGPAHFAIIEMQLAKHGTTVEYVLGNFNGDSPEAMLSKYFTQTIAWYDNQQRRERIIRGRLTAAKYGRVVMSLRTPYGYTYADGQLYIDPDEAAVVRRIFGWAADGWSGPQIAAELCRLGIPTRGDKDAHVAKQRGAAVWQQSTVAKIVRNPLYMGIWYYNKQAVKKGPDGKSKRVNRPKSEWIAVEVPAIVDADFFAQVQAQIDRNRMLSKRNTRQSYLLQHMIFCDCGIACGGMTNTETDTRFYVCRVSGKPWQVPCTVRFRSKADRLETAVWQAIEQVLLEPNNLRAAIHGRREAAAQGQKHLLDRLAAVRTALADTDRKLGLLLESSLAADFPRAIVEERQRLLLDQRQRLLTEERQAQSTLAGVSLSVEDEADLLAFGEHIRSGLKQLDFATRRQILLKLQVRVDALSRQRVRISALVPMQPAQWAADRSVGLVAEIDLETGAVELPGRAGEAATAQGDAE